MKKVWWPLTALALLLCTPLPGLPAEQPTQEDFLRNLVVGLGLSYGLPDEPEAADYLTVVGGDRTLRVEAEEAYDETDFVSVKTFPNFGPFSGSGWVSGVNTPTLLHLEFLLPWSGTYLVRSSLRGAGHTFDFGDQLLIGSGDEQFTEVDLGTVLLEAGPQEVTVELPPNGSIDYLELRAQPQPPLAPLAGWALSKPLTMSDLAEVAVVSLGLLDLLPPAERSRHLEAEAGAGFDESLVTGHRHLGPPSGGAWVRAGMTPVEVEIPFRTSRPEVFQVTFRGLGEAPVTARLDGRPLAELQFAASLSEITTPVIGVAEGDHRISVTLPPRTGLDALTLQYRHSDQATLQQLAGVQTVDEPVATVMSRLIALLAALAPPS